MSAASSDEKKTVVTMKLKEKDIKKYYSGKEANALFDVKDIIIHVRKKYPDPWQAVILDCKFVLPVEDLEQSLIFVKGINDNKASSLVGIGQFCYCPIELTDDLMQQEGYGIKRAIEEYYNKHIFSFDLLIYSDDLDKIQKVWKYMQESNICAHNIIFSRDDLKKILLAPNGIDLSPYAASISDYASSNRLTIPFLYKIFEDIGTKIKNGYTLLQDFEDTRSLYAKWLTQVMTQKYNLAPAYMTSFLKEYVDLQIAYPIYMLSMFERFAFLYNLPQNVGYIGNHPDFNIVIEVVQKIFPPPMIAFDMQSSEILIENLEQFSPDAMEAVDWRQWFKGSSDYYVHSDGTTAMAVYSDDKATDEQLRQIFLRMSSLVEDKIFMSIRNTILVRKGGKMYVLYYDQPFGLECTVRSRHFGKAKIVVEEQDFKRLIDVGFILSLNQTRKQVSTSNSPAVFSSFLNRLPKTFRPAIPADLIMYCDLVKHSAKELSYYDRRLRCDKSIMPVVTHEDSDMHREQTIFDYLDVTTVGYDKVAGQAISSFGTINPDSGEVEQVPVSCESFRGWKLL